MGAMLSKAWLTVLLACIIVAAAVSLLFMLTRGPSTLSGLATNADYVTGEQYGKADSVLFSTGEGGFRRSAHLASGRFPWIIGDDKISVKSDSSAAWTGIYHDGERLTDYTVSVNTTIVKTGLISEYPKYGIYAYYSDGDNFVVGMIDPSHGLFTSYYRINGTDGSWVNSPITFVDMAAENEIKAIRIGDEIRFYVNGVQVQKRNIEGMTDGYGGLIVEDMEADYTAFSVTTATAFDPVQIPELAQGWGFAQNGVPNGDGFEINSAQQLVLNSLDTMWPSIWYGDQLSESYQFTVSVRELERAEAADYPKYGVYAGFEDNENYVAVFLDAKNQVAATYGMLHGKPLEWQNTGISIDPSQYQELKVIRNGSTFAFYLNGMLLHTRDVDIGPSQPGVVAEGTRTEYDKFTLGAFNGFDPTRIPALTQGWGFAQSGVPGGEDFEIKSAQHLVLNSLDTAWPSIWYGERLSKSYQFTVSVRELERAKAADYPKYGVYAGFEDHENYVAVFLDAKNQVVTSYGLLHGKPMEWQNTGISIDPSKYHELKVIRNGSTFAFYLNGELMHTRDVNIGPSQPGVVAEGTRTEYDKFTLGAYSGFDGVVAETSNGWGKASNGNLATAGMQAVSEQKVVGNVLGKDWGRIWLSGSKSSAYDLSFTASSQQVGSTSDFPKYGVYAVYKDEDNYLRVMIDPVNSVHTTGGVLGGEDVGWENTEISFDFTKPLPLGVTRSSSTFSIYAGGELAQTRTLDFGAGDVGIVTEDSKATFDNIVFTNNR